MIRWLDCKFDYSIPPRNNLFTNGNSSCVTFALLGAALYPMIMLVNTTPDRIPADIVAEEQNAAREKMEGV